MSETSLFKKLRQKGLSGEKYVPEDAAEFIGPQKTRWSSWRNATVPDDTYWNRTGKHQDLNAELEAAMESGRYERNFPWAYRYHRYYNDGDIPRGIPGTKDDASYYASPYAHKYSNGDRAGLTALGERQLENNANAEVLNEYQKYLKDMESGKIPESPTGGYGLRLWDRKAGRPGRIVSFPDKESALRAYPRYVKEYGSVDLVEPQGPIIPFK